MTERERRAFNRGLETARKLAMLYADENFRMADETVKADPILMLLSTVETFEEDCKRSQDLMIQGHGHCATAHACLHLSEMIQGQKVRR